MKMGHRTTTTKAIHTADKAGTKGTGKHMDSMAADTDMDNKMRMDITSKVITMAMTLNDSRMMMRCGERSIRTAFGSGAWKEHEGGGDQRKLVLST